MLSPRQLEAFAKATGELVRESLDERLGPIVARLGALESRPEPEKGEKGDKGDPGERGEPGIQGIPGERGEKGETGDRGEKGEQGERGPEGPQGAPGPAGKSAYDLAVEAGFEGDLVAWLESLKGEKGDPGESGPEGPEGPDGPRGPQGEKGDTGVAGRSVTPEEVLAAAQEVMKAMQAEWALDFERRAQVMLQAQIDKIPKPKDGRDGRDAFELDDLDFHMGDDERTLTIGFRAGDKVIERSIRLSHPIYRGVWRPGEYQKGDTVTWGGSSWIAVRDTDSKPETDDSWKLAVKRGRDGRDK